MDAKHSDILKKLQEMLTCKDGKICGYDITSYMQDFITKYKSDIINYAQKRIERELKGAINGR